MNKTAKIIIGILVLVCGFLVVYSNIKAMEADKQLHLSDKLSTVNQRLKASLILKEQKGIELAAHAVKAQNKAEAAGRVAELVRGQLLECQKSK